MVKVYTLWLVEESREDNYVEREWRDVFASVKKAKDSARAYVIHEWRDYMWDGDKRKRTIWNKDSDSSVWRCRVGTYYELIIVESELK